jgi:hypothetical protein
MPKAVLRQHLRSRHPGDPRRPCSGPKGEFVSTCYYIRRRNQRLLLSLRGGGDEGAGAADIGPALPGRSIHRPQQRQCTLGAPELISSELD